MLLLLPLLLLLLRCCCRCPAAIYVCQLTRGAFSASDFTWYCFCCFGRFYCLVFSCVFRPLAARSLPLVPFLPFYCCLLFVVDDGKSFCQLPAEVLATLTSTSPSTSGMFYAFSYDFTSPPPNCLSLSLVCGEQESERPCKLLCTFEMCAPRRQQQ